MDKKFQLLVSEHELNIGVIVRLLIKKGVFTAEEYEEARESIYTAFEKYVEETEAHISDSEDES